jgi:beta-lactamase class A
MDHKTLIARLGGPHAVHARLQERGINILPVSVRAWALTDRNIPAKYWLHIQAIAAEQDIAVTIHDLAVPVSASGDEAQLARVG